MLTRLSRKPKYQRFVTPERIEGFMADLRRWARVEPEPPHAFRLERDRDDEVYIDLAVAVGAVYLTSQDNDLLDLMDPATETGAEFAARYPALTVLGPVALLNKFRKEP